MLEYDHHFPDPRPPSRGNCFLISGGEPQAICLWIWDALEGRVRKLGSQLGAYEAGIAADDASVYALAPYLA